MGEREHSVVNVTNIDARSCPAMRSRSSFVGQRG
jgi:hypothetical protein